MAFFISFSLLTMNTFLAIVTVSTAIFAFILLVYTLFINPPFKNDTNSSNLNINTNDNNIMNGNELMSEDAARITPSRLASNNLILVPRNKEAIIDLKGFGLENNDYVPPESVNRSSREIEAELHLNLEQAIIDADTNGTIFGNSTTTNLTSSPSLPSTTEEEKVYTEATIEFTEESETIEPKFEKILAFPECKKTKDGRSFC